MTLCDPIDCSTPGFPVHHQLSKLAQTHVHWVGDAIQPSHPLLSPLLLMSEWVSEVSEVAQSLSSLQPRGLYPTRLLCPWDSPGKNTGVGHVWQKPLQYCKVISLQLIKIKEKKKNTGVGCHFLLQGIFPTQGLNPGLPHCRQTL